MLGNDLLSRRVTPAVPSALEGLTSVFGKGTGVSPPPLSPNPGIIPRAGPHRPAGPATSPQAGQPHRPAAPATFPQAGKSALAGAAAAGAEAFDLPSLGWRDVVRTASHLAHESLFLHLAAELAQRLLELLGVLDDYSHNPSRIQAGRNALRG